MKNFILISILVPCLCFSQTKTDKIINQVGVAATVAGGVIGLFKKNKNADNKTETKNNNKTSANTNSDGTFSVNAKPEEVVAKLYKCTYKNIDDDNYCVWKSTNADYNILNQNNKDGGNYKAEADPKEMFATKIDTVLTFKQNDIDNIVMVTRSNNYNIDDKNIFISRSGGYRGFVRFQTQDGKQMKLVSNDKIVTDFMTSGGENSRILKLDEENIFYEVPYYEGGAGGHTEHYRDFYSLDSKYLFGYQSSSDWSNFDTGGYATYETEMKIDSVNKTIKLIESSGSFNKKGKLIKSTKETIGTYKYGNGTIIEIPTPKPAVKKTTTKKKK